MKVIQKLKKTWSDRGLVDTLHITMRSAYCHIIPFTAQHRLNMLLQKARGIEPVTEPNNIEYISPNSIQKVANVRFIPVEYYKGRILGGDWDNNTTLHEESTTFIGLYERFKLEYDWEDTFYYKSHKEKIENGKVRVGCTTIQDLKKRCRFLDRLYKSIADCGFDNGAQVGLPDEISRYDRNSDEAALLVHIDRNGQYILHDGNHRLTIAKLCELESVPIKIIVRHKSYRK